MGTVRLHSGQAPATTMLRRHVNKASVDELSVYRCRLTESDASELDHGCGCRGDGLAGVGRRARRAGARGVLGWKKGTSRVYAGLRRGSFSHVTRIITSTI